MPSYSTDDRSSDLSLPSYQLLESEVQQFVDYLRKPEQLSSSQLMKIDTVIVPYFQAMKQYFENENALSRRPVSYIRA